MDDKKKPMGRPRIWPKTTRVTVRVPDEYLVKIGGNMSEFIIEAIGEKLTRPKKS
jgi:hypothetical protein